MTSHETKVLETALDEFNTSNLINLGILLVTALVGILTWLGSRNAAREAQRDQKAANAAADRSASAAEEANRIQTRIVAIEEERQRQTALNEKKALLLARRDPSSKFASMWDLVVCNQGAATARNLVVTLAGKPFDMVDSGGASSPKCRSVIAPGGQMRHLLVSGGTEIRPPFECDLSWDDDSGIRGSWKSTLT